MYGLYYRALALFNEIQCIYILGSPAWNVPTMTDCFKSSYQMTLCSHDNQFYVFPCTLYHQYRNEFSCIVIVLTVQRGDCVFFRIKKETKPHYVIGTEAFLTLCLYILTTRKRKQISIEPRRMNQCNVIFNHSYISCNFVYLFMMINITISIRINTHLSEYKGAYLYIYCYTYVFSMTETAWFRFFTGKNTECGRHCGESKWKQPLSFFILFPVYY